METYKILHFRCIWRVDCFFRIWDCNCDLL